MRVLVALVLLIAVLFCSVSAQGEHLKNSNTFTWTGEVLADEIADLVATAVAEILSDSENSVMCVSVSDALNARNENVSFMFVFFKLKILTGKRALL